MTEEFKVIDRRKATKPIMEKRRRARINNSLNELKILILEALKRDTSCYSKLEKADILEMTVKHLKELKTKRMNDVQLNSHALANYRAGFNECASEVTRVVMSLDGMDLQLRTQLLNHLATCCHRNANPDFQFTLTQAPNGSRNTFPPTFDDTSETFITAAKNKTSISFKPIDNYTSMMSQYQLVPTYTNGQLTAVLVPAFKSSSYGVPQMNVLNEAHRNSLSTSELNCSGQSVKVDSQKVWRPF